MYINVNPLAFTVSFAYAMHATHLREGTHKKRKKGETGGDARKALVREHIHQLRTVVKKTTVEKRKRAERRGGAK